MTAFIAEGKRLGIPAPDIGNPEFAQSEWQFDDEGLCVTGCYPCRAYRNKVRAALEDERLGNLFSPVFPAIGYSMYDDEYDLETDDDYDYFAPQASTLSMTQAELDAALDAAYEYGVRDGMATLYTVIGDSVGLMQARADALLANPVL